MSETHKGILDREYANEAAKHFQESLALISDLLDYGTFLVPRAFVSSPRDLKATCLIFVQLRQFLVHLDGTTILAAAGNCSTATLQLRSLLETAHTLEWVLAADTDAKVNHLYVANLRRRRQTNALAISGSPEALRRADDAKRLTLLPPGQLKEIVDEVHRTDALLAQSPFNAIDAKFQQFYASHGYDQPWYEVYGKPSTPKVSIRKISEEIGRLEESTATFTARFLASPTVAICGRALYRVNRRP